MRAGMAALVSILLFCSFMGGAEISGPVTGYLFTDGRLHPIVGLPGAAYAGRAIWEGLDVASVAPDGRTALGVQGGKLVLAKRDAGDWNQKVVGESQADWIVWSGDSSAALLLRRSGGEVVIWRAGRLERLGNVEGPVTSASVGRSGQAAAVTQGESVLLFGESGLTTQVSGLADPAVAFGDSRLYILDRGTGTLFSKDGLDSSGPLVVMTVAGARALACGAGRIVLAGRDFVKAFDQATGAEIFSAAAEGEIKEIELISANPQVWLVTATSSPLRFSLLEIGLTPRLAFLPQEGRHE